MFSSVYASGRKRKPHSNYFSFLALQTARTYCAANSDDLEEAIEHVHRRYPNAPLMATGISLGG